ncbi:hypothetical protein O0I10_010576 [Lichtheimia ornata]|uniref:PROP1-like PPR domain-containing protein n=1 Tax=Lichtheimia ornata TaxID=688661 RepID=A0AAD7UW41_9FUNG|nr:uncharacterized protein O0I10_010576 [Lichtheimia ornata]KAJ8653777.1 hypothetical protein O0I10_010576 [Lichtheimia ornata]
MTHWQCRQLHSIASQHVNQRLLQQWRVLFLHMHTPTSRNLPTAAAATRSSTRRAFSSCSCKADKRSTAQVVETTTAGTDAFYSTSTIEAKRAAKRRIPLHISSQIDKSILSPQAISSAVTILSHLDAKETDLAWKAFEQLPRDSESSPGPRTIIQRMLASLRADIRNDPKNHQLVLHNRRLNSLLSYVRSTRLYLDENEFRIVLELLDRLDQLERAEVMLRTMGTYCDQPATQRTYNKLAAAYLRRIKESNGQSRRYLNKLETLIHSLDEQNITPDVVTFNVLLTAYGRMGRLKDVEAVFLDMEKHGITPNDRTFNIALDINGKVKGGGGGDVGNLERRLSNVLASVESGLSPDIIAYATTIRNAVLKRDMAAAERTLKAMVGKGILPNEYVYAHLVLGYVETGDVEKAHTVIQLMRKAPNALQPTAHLYGPLIQAYARTHEYKKAYQVLSEMMDQGIPANLTTYTILASMFVHSPTHEEPSKAIQVLRSLWKLTDDQEPLDRPALTMLIEAHGVAGARDLEWDPGWSFDEEPNEEEEEEEEKEQFEKEQNELSRRELHALGVQQSYAAIAHPDHLAHTALLTAYARLNMPENAWQFWTTLKSKETVLNTFHYNALIMGLVQSVEWYPKAAQVFQEMVDEKVTPDIATFDLMIYGAYSAGDLEAVQRFWRMDERPRPKESTNLSTTTTTTTTTADATSSSSPVPLIRSYYYALHAMVAGKDLQGAHDVFREFKSLSLSSMPASATLWTHFIHKLYHDLK